MLLFVVVCCMFDWVSVSVFMVLVSLDLNFESVEIWLSGSVFAIWRI